MAISKRGKTIILGYLMILPSFIFLVIFTYYPVFRSVWLSLFQKAAGRVTQFVGLENYEYMFGSNLFRQVMWNSLVYSLGSTIPAVVLGLLFALLINKKIKLRGFLGFLFSILLCYQ